MGLFERKQYFKKRKDMFVVEQLNNPDMTVKINGGNIIYKNSIINFDEQISSQLNVPNIGSWLVVLSVDKSGKLVYTYGAQTTDYKKVPTLPNHSFHLAMIELSCSTTQITNDFIYDIRQIFSYSDNNDDDTNCCKCCDSSSLNQNDLNELKEYYNKYEEVMEELEKIKLDLQPKKIYTILSDDGLKYDVMFTNKGELYTKRVDCEIPTTDSKILNYKLSFNNDVINYVLNDKEDNVQFPVKIRSLDANNETANCTLILKCNDTKIYNENLIPKSSNNEYRICNLSLTKAGYFDMFNLNFHNEGDHIMKLILLNNDTKLLIDFSTIIFKVTFENHNED